MATAAITGTATPSIREADIVAGGKTIIITLTGDTWVTAGATFDAQRQNIINGLDSAQAEAAGWDAQVKANLAVTTVVRTSNTVCTVTLSAQAAYNITARETVTVTIPASALAGAAQIVATPTINCVQGPATFYVATDGSDTAAGDTWATRRATIQSAVTSANTPGDVVYVAPGTFRETVTFASSGTAGNVISLIGDYTGQNTSGTKGVVRITGSADDIALTRANCVVASGKSYLTIQGFRIDTCSSHGIYLTNGSHITVTQCTVDGVGGNGIYSDGASQTTITVSRCFSRGKSGAHSVEFTHSSTVDNAAHLVQNCILSVSDGVGVRCTRVGGVTINNCTIFGCLYGVAIAAAVSAGQTVTVNNCIIAGCRYALLAAANDGTLVENYNTLAPSNQTARSNVATGANSVTRPPLFDPRWFFEAVNGGRLATPFDLASFSTLVEYNSGTGAPSTDMRGASTVGTYREWGALEYDATYNIAPGASRARVVNR